jgi:peptide/nickel transport system substrate-binding protein
VKPLIVSVAIFGAATAILLARIAQRQGETMPSATTVQSGSTRLDSRYGGELVYAYGVEPRTLFPAYELGSNAQEMWLNICENLVEIDERNEIVPWLAESWQVSEDGRNYTLRLRVGVRFTDGTPLDAQAVKFVFEETRRQHFVASNLLEGLERIETPHPETVVFRFREPLAAFLPNLAYRSLCIWSPAAYRERGIAGMSTSPVGTGPFLLDEWRHGEYIRFVRNPHYWQPGLPYLDALRVVLVEETGVRTMMVETAEVDRAVELSDFDLGWLDQHPHVTVRKVASMRQYYVVLNNLRPPLDNVQVRQALNFAVDKVGIVTSVFAGVGASVPKAPILSEGVVGFSDMTSSGEESLYPFDRQRAMALLDQAGFRDRDDDGMREDEQGRPLSLNLFGSRGRTKGDSLIAELVQSMLRAVGIDVRLRIWEWATFASLMAVSPDRAQYDMGLLSWGIATADPDEPMMLLFYSPSWKPVGSNRMFYKNPVVDRLALEAHHERDADRRRAIIRDWARLVIQDAPIVFLPTLTVNLATRTYVHGDSILPVENFPARFAWLDREEMARQKVGR